MESLLRRKVEDLFRKATLPATQADVKELDRVVPHLDTGKIPCGIHLSRVQEERVRRAESSLEVLASFAKRSPSDKAVASKVVKLWPNVWAWSEYLFHRAETNPEDKTGAALGPLRVSVVLDALILDQQAREMMVKTPGCIGVITHFWMMENGGGMGPPKVLVRLMAWLLTTPGCNLTEVVRSANGPRGLARTVIRRFRDIQNPSSFPDGQLERWMLILLELCRERDSDVHRALLVAGLVPQAVFCLSFLCGHSTESVAPKAMVQCVQLITSACRDTRAGLDWVLQALESDLLPTLMVYVAFFGPNDRGLVRSYTEFRDLINAVTPYLVYRRVIRHSARSVQLLHSTVNVQDPSPLTKLWLQFIDTIKKRERVREAFEGKFRRSCNHCGNSGQGRLSDTQKLRKCAGCCGPRYCSLHCQRKAWPSHREECQDHKEDKREMFDDSNVAWSLWDKIWMMKLGEEVLTEHAEEINNILVDEYPDTPSARILFALDASTMPADVQVDKLPTEDAMKPALDSFGRNKRVQMGLGFYWEGEKRVLAESISAPNWMRWVN